MHYDTIVVGGSYAGLSAALALVRSLRTVLIIDAGQRRNRFAHESHGFLGSDGRSPGAIAAAGRADVAAYPTATFVDGVAESAAPCDGGFAVTLAGGETHTAPRLILATGVVDELPDLPGLRAGWGRTVHSCPFCHGYEVAGTRLGVLALLPLALHHAQLIPAWGPTTFFTNGVVTLGDAARAALTARGVAIEDEPVAAVVHEGDALAGIRLTGGRLVPLDAIFTGGPIRQGSPLAAQLGCALDETPFGPFIRIDALGQTSVPGVFAAGDAASPRANIAGAVASGYNVGALVHSLLIPPLTHGVS